MRYADKKIYEQEDSFSDHQIRTTYLPHVKRMTNRLAKNLPNHVEREDLFQAGVIGLIEAFEHFDPNRNTQFLSYANFRIQGAVLSEVRGQDLHSRAYRKKVRAFENACLTLERRFGRAPAEEEVAGEMGLSLEEYYRIKGLTVLSVVSFDHLEVSSANEHEGLMDILIDHNQDDASISLERRELAQGMIRSINQLPKKERTVIILYYWEDLRMEQIGEILGVTLSRISQIHRQAITRLRKNVDKEFCPDDMVA